MKKYAFIFSVLIITVLSLSSFDIAKWKIIGQKEAA